MLAAFVFPILGLLTLWLLSRWTTIAKLPVYVTVTLLVSFFIPISTVALVPFDLVDDETLDNHKRLIMWRVIYWLSFLLMWLVLPLMQAYVESGYYNPWQKLKDASKNCLKSQLIILFCGAIGGIYMSVTAGLSFTSLKGLCIALSHSYGLLLVIWMLGHSAVSIPRSMLFNSVGANLHDLYCHATHYYDAYRDAQSNYDDVVAKIMALEAIKTEKYAKWIDSLIADISSQDIGSGFGVGGRAGSSGNLSTGASASASGATGASGRAQPRDLTPTNISDLGRRLYRDQSRLLRSRADWESLLAKVEYFEQLQSGTTHTRIAKIRPYLYMVGGLFLSCLSVIVIWSEIVSGTKLSLIDIIIRHVAKAFKVLFAALFLGYMCFLVNSALTSMRIFNLYAIVPKHTDSSSLIFFAAYALRLTVPLSYNFLMLTSTQETVFQEFLGKFINLTALGKYFNQVLPRLVIVPVLMTLFNVYDLVKDYLGFGFGLDYFGDDENEVVSAEPEGRDLVRRALQGFAAFQQPEVVEEQENTGLLSVVKGWFA